MGDLFRDCNEEMANITFWDALQRIMSLSMAALHKLHNLSEKLVQSILDTIMGSAIRILRAGKYEKKHN